MKYTVVIPTYNESENIEILIPRILGLGKEYHVLVVDDNSPDGTGETVKKIAADDKRVHLIQRPSKMGLGSAYIRGLQEAVDLGSDYIFEMDADHSHDYKDLPRFIEEMKKYDLVVGSRYVKGISVIDWPLPRLLLSYLGNLYARVITGLPTLDNTSGFKCFKREVLQTIDLKAIKSNGYAFQVEMNFRVRQNGFSVGELPIIFWGRYSGESKMSGNIVREAVFLVWKLRFESLIQKKGSSSKNGR